MLLNCKCAINTKCVMIFVDCRHKVGKEHLITDGICITCICLLYYQQMTIDSSSNDILHIFQIRNNILLIDGIGERVKNIALLALKTISSDPGVVQCVNSADRAGCWAPRFRATSVWARS